MKNNFQQGEFELKRQICEIGKRIWSRGYVAANDGNITIRINEKEILTTPTGVSKGFMTPDMIIKTDLKGKTLSGNSKYRPSSEVKMHIEVYNQREDINSVVHAHPPHCTSFAVAGINLNKCVLPEAIIVLGAVPMAKYGLPSTDELADSLKPHVQNADAILLQNHGAITLGPTLESAYHRMETLEHTAHIVFLAQQMGNVNVLDNQQVDQLMGLRQKFNLQGPITACQTSGAPTEPKPSDQDMISEITKKVLAKLGQK